MIHFSNPYYWLKKRWYHHQAVRAIWFLRYLDRTIHSMGWGHAMVRQFWVNFNKYPEARRLALNKIAVINKITIREQKRSRMERTVDGLLSANQKLQLELNKASAELARRPNVADDIMSAMDKPGQAQENNHEVPSV
jgi:hypothetical protein